MYKIEDCSFNTTFGTFEGHRIYASRKVAEMIEKQTLYVAELYNVEVSMISGIWPKNRFPCGDRDESRFSPDFQVPLSILGMEVAGDPNFPRQCGSAKRSERRNHDGSAKGT